MTQDAQTVLSRFRLVIPVVLRAVVLGCVVLTIGGLLTGPLLFANIKLWPAVPWSVPLLAAYLWLFWQFMRGRWWPRSTAAARREALRANPLPALVWRWALIAGYLAMAGSYVLHWVAGRLTPLGYAIPPLLREVPPFTMFSMLLIASAIAGVVEEAAFRGVMQGPIERRHGVVAAIAVVTIVFAAAHLTDWQPGMTLARMFFIVLASVVYGILVHLTNSILPGIVLHATGDAIGIVWIWWLGRRPGAAGGRGFAAAAADPWFWANCLVAVALGIAAVWAFRRLAAVSAAAAGGAGSAGGPKAGRASFTPEAGGQPR